MAIEKSSVYRQFRRVMKRRWPDIGRQFSFENVNVSFWLSTAVVAFLYIPMVLILIMSVNDNIGGMFPFTGFTFEWYSELATDSEFWKSFAMSGKLMVATAVSTIVLGLPAVYGLEKLSKHGFDSVVKVWVTLLTVPLYVPLILVGIALLLYLSELNVEFGFFTRLLGHIVYVFPFTFLILYSGMKTVPSESEEAARDLGASRIEAFILVIVPQMFPSIVSAFIFASLLSLNEFIITFMISGTGTPTIPLLVFSRLRTHLTPEMNAIGVLLLVIGLVAAVIAARFDPRVIQ